MKTLKITKPFGQTFFRSISYLLLFCIAAELFARTPVARILFPRESYGSSHPHLEIQIIRLRDYIAQGGSIDCVFIGNSQVLYGIQPAVVEQAYKEQTGRTIHCQNFGLGGLTPITAGPLARALIKKFHPSLIVFETSLLDYSSSGMEGTDVSIMSSPWIKYQLGTFSIDGWLYEYSSAYRRILGIDRSIKNIEEKDTHIAADGHATLLGQSDTPIEDQMKHFDTTISSLEITEHQTNGLQDLLSINSNEAQIVIIEAPINPIFYSSKRKVRLLYPDFKNMLMSRTGLVGSSLWLTRDAIKAPENDWHDLAHFNNEGSIYFSYQLGKFLAGVYSPPARVNP